MGWASGVNGTGRKVGYAVRAKCDERKCKERIDRGLGYVCGDMHDGGEHGCGNYFCSSHLYLTLNGPGQLCKRCVKDFEALSKEEAK